MKFVLKKTKEANGYERSHVETEDGVVAFPDGYKAEEALEVFNRIGHGALDKKAYVESMTAPDGFTQSMREDRFGRMTCEYIVFKSDDVVVEFGLGEKDKEWEALPSPCGMSGTVNFKVHGKWYTFDRPGIEQSFYDDFRADPQAILEAQIVRARAEIERMSKSTYVQVPGTQITLEATHKKKISDDLKAGKGAQITPAGMGIGYALSTKKQSQWSHPVPAMAKFFGVTKLYADTLDCD